MKLILSVFTLLMATSYSMYVPRTSQYRFPIRQSRSEPGVFKSIGDFFHKMHVAATKRCAYLLDESCANGGIPGAGSDSQWLNEGFNPGKRALNRFQLAAINRRIPLSSAEIAWLNKAHSVKRCVNTMDESCSNGGIPGSGSDNDWLDGGFNPGKRSLNLFEEGAINGGVSGSGADNDWLNNGFNPGKRNINLFEEGAVNGGIPGAGSDKDWLDRDSITSPGKRCVNIMDESCSNGGIPGSGSDDDWLNGGFNPGKRGLGEGANMKSHGKRCVNTMDESCSNGGIPGSGSDNDWLDGGFNPGKRMLSEAEGISGAANDNDWLHGDKTPGKR